MPDLKSLDSVYLVLAFIVPGMIITLVRAQFFTGRVRTLAESAITYLALTILYYGLAAPFVEYVISVRDPGREKVYAWLVMIILLPAVIGFVLGMLGQNDVFRRILHVFGINPVHATPCAWDFAFARLRGDHFVMVTLSDGSSVTGIYGRHSFASTDPTERDILLQEIWDLEDQTWTKRTEQQAILIPAREIKHVQIWNPKGL